MTNNVKTTILRKRTGPEKEHEEEELESVNMNAFSKENLTGTEKSI